jgi:hypothetical protein
MKAYEGVEEVWLHEFLTTVLDGDEWSASHVYRLTPGERAPLTYVLGIKCLAK